MKFRTAIQATPDMFAAYFYAAILLASLSGLVSAATGRSGFSITPYLNGIFAIAIFVALSWRIYSHSYFKICTKSAPIFLTITLMLFIGPPIGIANGNPIVYIVSTAVYWSNWALFIIYATMKSSIPNSNFTRLVSNIGVASIALEVFRLGTSNETNLLLLTSSIVLAINRNYRLALLCLVPFLLDLGNLNRGTMLAATAATLATLAIYRRGTALAIILAIFLFAFLQLASTELSIWIDPTSQLYRRLHEIQVLMSGQANVESLIALQQRLFEIQLVNEYTSQGWMESLFGGGFGKTIDMRGTQDVAVSYASLLGSQAVHNIHSLPHSLILRSGYLGILLLSLVVLTMSMNLYLFWKNPKGSIALAVCCIYPVTALFNALPASNYFLTDFIIAGMITYAAREQTHRVSRARTAGAEKTL